MQNSHDWELLFPITFSFFDKTKTETCDVIIFYHKEQTIFVSFLNRITLRQQWNSISYSYVEYAHLWGVSLTPSWRFPDLVSPFSVQVPCPGKTLISCKSVTKCGLNCTAEQKNSWSHPGGGSVLAKQSIKGGLTANTAELLEYYRTLEENQVKVIMTQTSPPPPPLSPLFYWGYIMTSPWRYG